MPLSETLVNYRNSISQVNDYISLAYQTTENGEELLTDDKKEFIVTSAFLKMFIAWEELLEDVFLQYLLGEKSINNTEVIRFVIPNNRDHANKILIGTQKYVDWANHEIVIRLSKLFFEDGEPFSTALNSINSHLADLKIIRNASAHISTTTQMKLDSLASRKTNSNISGAKVSDLIMTISREDSTKTILQYYQLLLDITAENLTNNII